MKIEKVVIIGHYMHKEAIRQLWVKMMELEFITTFDVYDDTKPLLYRKLITKDIDDCDMLLIVTQNNRVDTEMVYYYRYAHAHGKRVKVVEVNI